MCISAESEQVMDTVHGKSSTTMQQYSLGASQLDSSFVEKDCKDLCSGGHKSWP